MRKDIKHKPLRGILDRELSIADAQELIDRWAPLIEELCNLASNVLARCEKSMKGVKGTPSSLILLHYHVIRMADGINATCSRACFIASTPMLRSLWEGALSIQFMLQDDFEARSSAWLAHCHANSRTFLECLDPTTSKGKAIQAKREKDELGKYLSILDAAPDGLSNSLSHAKKLLRKDKFMKALDKTRTSKGKRGRWHRINGGPRDMQALAGRLGKPLEYEFLYRDFSGISHAQNISRAFVTIDGVSCFNQIRSRSHAELIYNFAALYLARTTIAVAEKLRPDEDVAAQIDEVVKRHGFKI